MDLATFDLAATATGFSFLSPEILSGAKVSLPVLQKEYGFSKMYLWGKLKGLASDYIIAVGVSHSLKETTKKYFYCFDGVSWAQMAEPSKEVAEACAKIPAAAMLSGDAQFVYTVAKALAEGEEPPENEEDLSVKVTEDVRAAYLVKQIDANVAMVPVGSIALDPKLNVPAPNSTFRGLGKEASLSLSSWELLDGTPATQQLAGSLKAKFLPAASLTALRSMLWPGFTAFCAPGSNVSGYVYVGDGMKNADIAFCLP